MGQIGIKQFREISSGEYNMGEVCIGADNKLEKVNNFVHRVKRNTTVLTVEANFAVRTALFKALSADPRMHGEMLREIEGLLLGDNHVRSLSRREVALYIAALDRGNTIGLADAVKSLRDRHVVAKNGVLSKIGDYVPSPTEKLDQARMEVQRTRQLLEKLLRKGDNGVSKNRMEDVCSVLGSLSRAAVEYNRANGAKSVKVNLPPIPDKVANCTAREAAEILKEIFRALLDSDTLPVEFKAEAQIVLLGDDASKLCLSTRYIMFGDEAAERELAIDVVREAPNPEDLNPDPNALKADVQTQLEQYPLNDVDRKRCLNDAAALKAKLTAKIQRANEPGQAEEFRGLLEALTEHTKRIQDMTKMNPVSYRNVLSSVRDWTKAADYLYGRFCTVFKKPVQEHVRSEIFLSQPYFDDVKDFDADCPDAEAALKDLDKRIARKLSVLLSAQGIEVDSELVKKCLRNVWEQVLERKDWKTIEKSFDFRLGGAKVKAGSSIAPALQIPDFAKNIEGGGYGRGVKGIMCHNFKTKHAANLAQSTFSLDGKAVFAGVRHGVNCAIGISKAQERREANVQRAKEVLTAAALTNEALLEAVRNSAPGTKTLDFDLFVTSTSLLTPDALRPLFKGKVENERLMLQEQCAAWDALDGRKLEVKVSKPDGTEVIVKVTPSILKFNFGVNKGAVGKGMPTDLVGGWDFSDGINNDSLNRLGEKVTGFLDSVRSQIADLDVRDYERRGQLGRLIDTMHTLRRQIVEIHAAHAERRDDNDAYKIVARINVLTHLMGGTPAWNCKSGKDRTGELDVESKFLATLISKRMPIPNPGDLLTPEQQDVFRRIAIEGGNHELQLYNTGLAGFKTKGVDSIGMRLGSGDAQHLHAGASEYVKV